MENEYLSQWVPSNSKQLINRFPFSVIIIIIIITNIITFINTISSSSYGIIINIIIIIIVIVIIIIIIIITIISSITNAPCKQSLGVSINTFSPVKSRGDRCQTVILMAPLSWHIENICLRLDPFLVEVSLLLTMITLEIGHYRRLCQPALLASACRNICSLVYLRTSL